MRSCLALSHSSSVAITTGFPTHYMHRYKHTHTASWFCVTRKFNIGLYQTVNK